MILLPWLEAFPGKFLQLNFPHQLRFSEGFSTTWGLGLCNPPPLLSRCAPSRVLIGRLCLLYPPGQAGSVPFHSPVQLGGLEDTLLSRAPCSLPAFLKQPVMFCSSSFPLLPPPGGCMPLDGFSPPRQPLTTLQVCSQTVFILFPRQKFWGESSSRTVCQDGERREEVGKGVTHHKHRWEKPLLFVKRAVGKHRERESGWHAALCGSRHGVILEPRWDGNAEMILSLSWEPELTLRKGRERKRGWVWCSAQPTCLSTSLTWGALAAGHSSLPRATLITPRSATRGRAGGSRAPTVGDGDG